MSSGTDQLFSETVSLTSHGHFVTWCCQGYFPVWPGFRPPSPNKETGSCVKPNVEIVSSSETSWAFFWGRGQWPVMTSGKTAGKRPKWGSWSTGGGRRAGRRAQVTLPAGLDQPQGAGTRKDGWAPEGGLLSKNNGDDQATGFIPDSLTFKELAVLQLYLDESYFYVPGFH